MLHVMTSGYRFVHAGGLEINRPTGAGHYVFVYYRTPCGFHAGETVISCQGLCILLAPGTPHRYRSARAPYVNDWVHFTADEAGTALIGSLGVPTGALLAVREYAPIGHAVEALQRLEQTDAPWRETVARSHLVCLLHHLAGAAPAGGQRGAAHKYRPVFEEIRAELYRMPGPGTDIKTLAGKAGLSVSRFHHLYRQLWGHTAGEDIARGRLERAKYLLQNSSLPVAAVAESSGYTGEVQMIRHFGKYLGTTPGRYRRAMR